MRRVVVTGLGAVSPVGIGWQNAWKTIVNGGHGITRMPEAVGNLPSQVAAVVEDFNASDWIERKQSRLQSTRFIAFGMGAAKLALDDCQLLESQAYEPERVGVALGSGIGSMEEIGDQWHKFEEQGDAAYRRVSPYFIPRMLLNMAGSHISMRYNFQGPLSCVSTACATGANAIGDAYRLIKYNDADAMIAGGTESCINAVSVAGFARARALSTKYNDTPGMASRPFDEHRDGFVIGEGAACLILEEREAALKRGAHIYAEICGYGQSAEAYHPTSPRPDGEAAFRCMRNALKEGACFVEDLQYINAHATGTAVGDAAEIAAIDRLLGDAGEPVAVSSTKGATGHLLGAAGAIESLFTCLAVSEGKLPPTRNLEQPRFDPYELTAKSRIHLPSGTSEDRPVLAALCNSFGFGGTNVSLLFKKPQVFRVLSSHPGDWLVTVFVHGVSTHKQPLHPSSPSKITPSEGFIPLQNI